MYEQSVSQLSKVSSCGPGSSIIIVHSLSANQLSVLWRKAVKAADDELKR